MGEAELTNLGVQNEGIIEKTVRLGDDYRLPVRKPGPAELIRAVQRDNDCIDRLTLDLNETIHEIFGQKGLNKWNSLGQSKSFPILLYLSLTNLSGLQTIGEEYVGVIQLDKSGLKLPGKKSVLGMIFLSAYGGQLMDYFLKTTERFLISHNLFLQTNLDNRRSFLQELELWTKRIILTVSSVVKRNIPFFSQVHLTLFFLSGRFYEVAKRLTGIHFVLVRNWYASQDKESRRNVRYLVWLSVFNSIFTIATVSADFLRTMNINETDFNVNYNPGKVLSSSGVLQQQASCQVEVPGRKCSLCLENGKDWSVTPCGHLFCWTCIMDWFRTKQECPVCRDSFKPSRILPLLNLK